MQKLFVVLAIFMLSQSAWAQYRESEDILEKLIWNEEMLNVMLDLRTDFQIDFSDGNTEKISFIGQTFKVWFAGEIIPGITYRVRQRLNKEQSASARDKLSEATDQAWVAFAIRKKFTVTIGRQSVQLGTFEYDYNAADVYLSSLINRDFDSHKTGVNAAYNFGGHTVNFQIINSDSPQFATNNYNNKALAYNFLWQGNLFDKAMRTRFGYGLFQHNKDKYYNWITPGLQLNIGKFISEFDYYIGERNIDYGSAVGNDELGLRHVKDQSASVKLEYNSGKWRPFVKGVWGQRFDKDFDDKVYEEWGIQAVVEFYPFDEAVIKDLRFHVAYTYTDTNCLGQFSDYETKGVHSALAGVRWFFKVK